MARRATFTLATMARSKGRLLPMAVVSSPIQTTVVPEEDEPDEILDPSALLLVLEALARLTHGIAIDPQAGTVLYAE